MIQMNTESDDILSEEEMIEQEKLDAIKFQQYLDDKYDLINEIISNEDVEDILD